MNGWGRSTQDPTRPLQTIPGSPITTRYRRAWTANMPATSSAGRSSVDIFLNSWANVCLFPWEDTSITLTSATTEIGRGQHRITQVGLYKQPEAFASHPTSWLCGPGAASITRPGSSTSGPMVDLDSRLTLKPWTRSPQQQLTGQFMPDIGKTCRNWKFRYVARARRRLSRRRGTPRTQRISLCFVLFRLVQLLLAMFTKCPSHVDHNAGSTACCVASTALCNTETPESGASLLQLAQICRVLEQQAALDLSCMATGSSSGRPEETVEAPVEPHEPPYGPPPPQNLFSLRLSQALVDALKPKINHQGAFLTRIQGRITDCVGITATLRPMTPNEFLHTDVLYCSDEQLSELEDPEDVAEERPEDGRTRARRASAEWLERRGEIEELMSHPVEIEMGEETNAAADSMMAETSTTASSSFSAPKAKPKVSRKYDPYLILYSCSLLVVAFTNRHPSSLCPGEHGTHTPDNLSAFYSLPGLELWVVLSGIVLALCNRPDIRSVQTGDWPSRKMPYMSDCTTTETCTVHSSLQSSMLARCSTTSTLPTAAGPLSRLLLALLIEARQVLRHQCVRCLQLLRLGLLRLAQIPAHIPCSISRTLCSMAGCFFSTTSRVGPKSGHIPGRHVCHLIFVLFLFTLIPTVESGAVDARVVDLPTHSRRSQLGRGRPACLPLKHQADALNDRIAEHIPELASKEERSTRDNGDLRHGSGVFSYDHSTFDLSGRHHRHMFHTGEPCRGTAGALQRTYIENWRHTPKTFISMSS